MQFTEKSPADVSISRRDRSKYQRMSSSSLRIRKDKDGCYEAVYSDAGNIIPAVNSAEVETEQCCKALSKGANGNADIADIALQQLMEVQDS
jgi:hypothetical protein